MLIEQLRYDLQNVFKNRRFNKIDTNFRDYRIKQGLGFFPHGNGVLTKTQNKIPGQCILILGKDFGTINYFRKVEDNGEEKRATLRNLLLVIDKQFREQVFLSNVLMGLRETGGNTNQFKEHNDENYQSLCRNFLRIQIEKIRPKLIITLGEYPDQFLKNSFRELGTMQFRIPHPSWWHVNLKRAGLTPNSIHKLLLEKVRA